MSSTSDTTILHSSVLQQSFAISRQLHRYLAEYCASEGFKLEFRRRSHLFVPLNKPRFKEKIGHGEVLADGFIWDLEDSIPPGQKQVARESIPEIPRKPGNVEYCVRVNMGEPHLLEKDIEAVIAFPFDSVTLPKGESGEQIAQLMKDIGEDRNYIVTIETIKGLKAVDEIASVLRPGRDALGFGVGDMSTDLGVERISTTESALFQQILGQIALAAKARGLDLFDSVSARLHEIESVQAEAELSAHVFGFTGKKLINPKHLDAINGAFSPKAADIQEQLATLEVFLGSTNTNAHVVGTEYKGMPAFKAANAKIKRLLRQGYFPDLILTDSSHELKQTA
ncbi:MAG: hypothetical protein F6K55_36190 [Moorea sp. SIO4A3]|nr:hypothetical protein [Moorena sp. SIO4A3]